MIVILYADKMGVGSTRYFNAHFVCVLVHDINLSERNFVAEDCIYTVMLFHNVDMMCFHSRCEAQ